MALLVLLNNFMHDFSAAGWVFGGVVLFAILRKISAYKQIDPVVKETLKVMRVLMGYCLFGIVFLGSFERLPIRHMSGVSWPAAARLPC